MFILFILISKLPEFLLRNRISKSPEFLLIVFKRGDNILLKNLGMI